MGAWSERDAGWWQGLIRRVTGSGKRISEACLEEGVTPHQYYYWRRRVMGAKERQAPGFHPAVAVTLGGEIEIRSSGGYSVIVRGAVNRAHVREVLLALEGEV